MNSGAAILEAKDCDMARPHDKSTDYVNPYVTDRSLLCIYMPVTDRSLCHCLQVRAFLPFLVRAAAAYDIRE